MNDVTIVAEAYRRWYADVLRHVSIHLKGHLRTLLREVPNVDRVTSRAKAPDRFIEKARRINGEGRAKYRSPLTEIQDIIGARIVVFYPADVEVVVEVVRRYFQPIEQANLVPESDWAFGYFGRHLVLPMPGDVVPRDIDRKDVPAFFELQIKTLFQHAWAEANHDLGYKAMGQLSSDQLRRLAYTAAQAWGADRVFAELSVELDSSPSAEVQPESVGKDEPPSRR